MHEPNVNPVPSPWQGDPGVVFLGCAASAPECGGDYEAGAIRIDNPPTNPALTLTAASVTIGPCTFTPWGQFLPATVGPGQILILTQTGVLGPPQPPPCDASLPPVLRPYFNFDTALGPFDNPPNFNCDPALVPFPVITLTFANGFTLTVTDTQEVLNAGGANRFVCQGLPNSAPWTPVSPQSISRS